MIEIFGFAYLITGMGFLLVGKELENPSVKMLGGMLLIFGIVTLIGYVAGQRNLPSFFLFKKMNNLASRERLEFLTKLGKANYEEDVKKL